jgi:hypothetical protein
MTCLKLLRRIDGLGIVASSTVFTALPSSKPLAVESLDVASYQHDVTNMLLSSEDFMLAARLSFSFAGKVRFHLSPNFSK